MPRRVHSRIQADVIDAEERELQRLEGRGAGGSTGSDARLRRESGGNLQQHGERAATGEGGRPDRPSWSEVLCAACDCNDDLRFGELPVVVHQLGMRHTSV